MVSALVTCAATIGLAPRLNTLATSPSYAMNYTQSDAQYILTCRTTYISLGARSNTYIYFSINAIHSKTFYTAIIKLSSARDQGRYREVGSLSAV